GPYAFVRHPGYTAGILIIAASGPALGSWLAAALVVIFSLPFLLYPAITEDRILQVELAGYSDYAARVRWGLVPGVWVEANPAGEACSSPNPPVAISGVTCLSIFAQRRAVGGVGDIAHYQQHIERRMHRSEAASGQSLECNARAEHFTLPI